MKARAKAGWQLEAEEMMLIHLSSCMLGSWLLALSAHSSLIAQAYNSPILQGQLLKLFFSAVGVAIYLTTLGMNNAGLFKYVVVNLCAHPWLSPRALPFFCYWLPQQSFLNFSCNLTPLGSRCLWFIQPAPQRA